MSDERVKRWSDFLWVLVCTLLLCIPAGYEPRHFAKLLFAGAFVQSLFYVLVAWWLTRRSIGGRTTVFTIAYLLFIVETFTFIFFESRFDPGILTLILQTSGREISEFFQTYVWSSGTLLFLAAVVVVYGLLLWLLRPAKKHVKLWPVLVSAGLFVVTWLPLPFPIGQNTINELAMSVRFVQEKHGEIALMKQAIDNIKVYAYPEKEEAPVIVMVIGESFNRNHSSLYGYGLETSPLMERERAEGRLTVFTDVHTPTNGTDYAMRYLFTLKGCETDHADSSQYVLMPAVMKKAHYGVAYFDNQYTRSSGGSLDYSCGYFLNPTYINDHCFDYRNTETKEYDGDFINDCRKQFLTTHRSLNIIHLQGQHFNAARRYPASYGVFSASDIQRSDLSESQRQQVAEYDNATRYNDYVLGMIIDSFRKTDAVIIYLADHGEQIYDGREQNFGRGFSGEQDEETLRNVYHIPMMIWCSDGYIAHHAEQYQRIQTSAGRKFCSADIPYLLFDLAEVDFNHNHQERSVIDSLFKPHETLITDY